MSDFNNVFASHVDEYNKTNIFPFKEWTIIAVIYWNLWEDLSEYITEFDKLCF